MVDVIQESLFANAQRMSRTAYFNSYPKTVQAYQVDAVAYFDENVYEIGDIKANEVSARATIHFIGAEKPGRFGRDAVAFI